ncbi:MAG: Lrp/AsnC family transcriptional regulator [Beijerinckiaceae bacterium]
MARGLDDLDRRILRELQADATLSIADLASRVSLSQTPCWKRIQKLEAMGVIERRVAILNPEALGLGLAVLVAIEAGAHSEEWLKAFTEKVAALPEVLDLYRMAGETDYELRVIVPDMQSYDAFYKKLIELAPIRNVTSRFVMERIKSTTNLPIRLEREPAVPARA